MAQSNDTRSIERRGFAHHLLLYSSQRQANSAAGRGGNEETSEMEVKWRDAEGAVRCFCSQHPSTQSPANTPYTTAAIIACARKDSDWDSVADMSTVPQMECIRVASPDFVENKYLSPIWLGVFELTNARLAEMHAKQVAAAEELRITWSRRRQNGGAKMAIYLPPVISNVSLFTSASIAPSFTAVGYAFLLANREAINGTVSLAMLCAISPPPPTPPCITSTAHMNAVTHACLDAIRL
ncbi:hypothetical protein TcWFU_007872 [Taenia crassiceps]|uniref:Uncharacterized protein n=1 Tax=Taenia crassiceps TaxID=6207 RepID=A0ABR4Q549_9CEST